MEIKVKDPTIWEAVVLPVSLLAVPSTQVSLGFSRLETAMISMVSLVLSVRSWSELMLNSQLHYVSFVDNTSNRK